MPGLVNPARNRAGMQACADCLNEEFKPENAGLGHNDPSVFLKSQVSIFFICTYKLYESRKLKSVMLDYFDIPDNGPVIIRFLCTIP